MKYSQNKISECAEWVRQNGLMEYGGATVKDYCDAMGINQDTHYEWLKKTEYSDAIKRAQADYKDTLEVSLVDSLVRKARGYDMEEKKTEYVNVDGQKKIKRQTTTTKHFQPDTGAAIFLLTNVAPDRWKNKINQEHSGEVASGLTIIVKDEEEKELIKSIENL